MVLYAFHYRLVLCPTLLQMSVKTAVQLG